jgi:hypothetical protein
LACQPIFCRTCESTYEFLSLQVSCLQRYQIPQLILAYSDARYTQLGGLSFALGRNALQTRSNCASVFIRCGSALQTRANRGTDASVHDSQALDGLLDTNDEGQPLHADSAYTGEDQEGTISKFKMENNVHEKGYRNNPLTEEQKAANKVKSKTRARVEHVFGFMEQSMNGLFIRSVGLARATGTIGLINLTYNLFRYEQVVRLSLFSNLKTGGISVPC